ncbi:MAG: PHP domain-containing protein, partial [Zoogloea sp.]|nr:PHP domain-containing protein [Zoogloea sp.]
MTSLPSPAFAELYCRSNFSFLTGASHPEELVAQAMALGYAALAITDECSLAGVVRAHAQWRQQPDALQLLIGTSLQLADGPRLVLIATDRPAYGRLSSLISKGRRAADKGAYHLQRRDLENGLPGCLALLLPPDTTDQCPDGLATDACWLARLFPGSSWLAAPLQLGPDDAGRRRWIAGAARRAGIAVVSTCAPLMHTPERKAVADVLGALRHRCSLDEAGYLLAPNREAHLQPRARLGKHHPAEWLAETLQVAARCDFTLDTLRYEYPEEIVPPGATATSHLRALVEQGLRRRYPDWAVGKAPLPEGIRAQVDKELTLIAELRYEAFFLTVEDIVRFARSQGILCQGRGSAANSVVCYALGVTEVAPAEASLLFERFISRERNEPPDIDVDFEHDRREEVIQYIYRKYGRDR